MNSLRSPNRRSTRPGAILREDVLPALAMTQVKFVERLGISRVTVSELLNEKRELSTEMALRLGRLLDAIPESGLAMQDAVDLWEVRNAKMEELEWMKPVSKRKVA